MSKSTLVMGVAVAAMMAFPAAGWSETISQAPMMRDRDVAATEFVRSDGIEFGRHGFRHRNKIGIGIGAGIVGGLLLGEVLGNRYYRDRNDYYDDQYDDEVYIRSNDDQEVSYCLRRFRSYDPNSGTYLGYDGYRHPCP